MLRTTMYVRINQTMYGVEIRSNNNDRKMKCQDDTSSKPAIVQSTDLIYSSSVRRGDHRYKCQISFVGNESYARPQSRMVLIVVWAWEDLFSLHESLEVLFI